MSALYVLVLALLWLGVGALTRRLWSAYFVPERGISRRVRVYGGWGLLLLWLFVPFYLLYGRTALLDAEVRELCAKDGGVKVYETVKLPPERFDQWGMVTPYDPTQKENALGPEYVFREESKYFKKEPPTFIRHHYQVIRRTDGKVLGETVSYGRGGGDLPGPWFPSSFVCPEVSIAGPNALLKAVFVQSNKGE